MRAYTPNEFQYNQNVLKFHIVVNNWLAISKWSVKKLVQMLLKTHPIRMTFGISTYMEENENCDFMHIFWVEIWNREREREKWGYIEHTIKLKALLI